MCCDLPIFLLNPNHKWLLSAVIGAVSILLYYLVVSGIFYHVIGNGDIKYSAIVFFHLGLIRPIDRHIATIFLLSTWVAGGVYAMATRIFKGSPQIPLAPAIFIALNIAQNS